MAGDKLHATLNEIQGTITNKINTLDREISKELEKLKALPQEKQAGPDSGPLWAACRNFANAYTQVDLLHLLVDAVACYVPRVLLLIRKSGNLHGWDARGFGDDFQKKNMKKVKWSIDAYPELSQAVEHRKSLGATFGDLSEIGDAISGFDGFVPLRSCFIPLVVKNKVAAVLYIDSGSESQLENRDLADLLCYVAGLELSLVTAKIKAAPSGEDQATPAPAPPETPEQPTPQAFESQEEEASASTATASASLDDSGFSDEDAAVKKAKRVARVLVSDLKLYNEEAVKAAVANGDLYGRLKEDLDRSHKHYQERVSGLLKDPKVNYFKDELIRQLANGNAELLGPIPF